MVDATTLAPAGPLVGPASGAAQAGTQSRGGIEDSELVPNRVEHELRAALRTGVEHESTATVDLHTARLGVAIEPEPAVPVGQPLVGKDGLMVESRMSTA